MRLGLARPSVAQDSLHPIGVPSSHSQVWLKLAGNDNAGVKLIALCIELCIPPVSSGCALANSAPIRVVATSAADLAASIPKSTVPAAIRITSGATSANSAATLPALSRVSFPVPVLHLMSAFHSARATRFTIGSSKRPALEHPPVSKLELELTFTESTTSTKHRGPVSPGLPWNVKDELGK